MGEGFRVNILSRYGSSLWQLEHVEARKPNEFSENMLNGEVTSEAEWWLHGDPWLALICGAQRVEPRQTRQKDGRNTAQYTALMCVFRPSRIDIGTSFIDGRT